MSGQKKNWKKRLLTVCATLFVLYVLIGFAGVPLLLRYVALRMVNKELAGTVSVEAIRSNPFSYSLLLRGIDVRTPDGQSVFAAGRFYGNFAFWSLFGKGWRFQEVHLQEPSLNVAVDGQGRLNLLQMLKTAEGAQEAHTPEATESEPIVIPLVRVDRLWVQDGGFDLTIALPGGEFHRQGRAINLELIDFSSDPQSENPYAFAAHTAHGESVQVDGRLRLNPLSTRGTVSVSTVQLDDFDLFTADALGLELDSGSLSLSFGYLFSPVSEPRGLFLEDGKITVEDVAVSARSEAQPFARLGLFEAAGFGIDLLKGEVRLERVRIAGGSLRVVRDKDGLLNLVRYLFPEERQREIIGLVQEEIAQARQRSSDIRLGVISDNQDIGVALTSAWHQVEELLGLGPRLSIGEVVAEGNVLELRDEFPATAVQFVLSDMALEAQDARNFGAEPFPFAVSLRTGQSADAQTRGTVAVKGGIAPEGENELEFSSTVSDIDLVAFAPYLAPFTSAHLASARVSALAEGVVGLEGKELPRIALKLGGRLDALRLEDPDSGQAVLAVESAELDTAQTSLEPLVFAAGQLTITRPQLLVVRNRDGEINLLRLVPMLAATQGAEPAADTPAQPDQPPADAAAPGSASDWQSRMVADAVEAAKHTQVGETLLGAGLESVSLQRLKIVDGKVTILDEAVDPAVSFSVSEAELQVDSIGFAPDNVTTLNASARLEGDVTGAVADVSGELVTLDPLRSAKLSILLRDIALGSFGGYSEPVVGRPIARGSLAEANLGYTITNASLKGDNRINMKDVGFDARREGSTGPRLPLDLGIAILTDRNGMMRLDVPVSGDLTDPSFSLGRVIQYAIVNVLERLVTAPFSVLGSLLGSEPGSAAPANAVVFAVASAEIPAERQQGLAQLAHALYERPGLLLQLRPVTTNAEDLQALREALLEQRITAYAQQHNITTERATERLYEQLLAALAAMDPQTRAGIEAMIERAQARAARSASASAGAEELALAVPPPVVEGSAAATMQTVNVRSLVRSRKGGAFLVSTEAVQVLVSPADTDAAAAAAATSAGIAEQGDGDMAATAPVSADAAIAPAAADAASAKGSASASAQNGGSVAEPLLADKRSILLAQTVVSQESVQALANARMKAIAEALASDAEHPLAAERIREGEPWQPQASDPTQTAVPGVYFELGVAE